MRYRRKMSNAMWMSRLLLLLMLHVSSSCVGDPRNTNIVHDVQRPRKDDSRRQLDFQAENIELSELNAKAKRPAAIEQVDVVIDTTAPISRVEDYFIGFNIDSDQFRYGCDRLNFSSVRLHTLIRALSPAILRVGGGPADWLFFDKPSAPLKAASLRPGVALVTKEDITDLVELTRSTGNRLLYDLNLQLRFGKQWDPSNTIELFEFCRSRGYGDNIDWELGNEPDAFYTWNGQVELSPRQIANDFTILHRVLEKYPNFNNSRIVGPDNVGSSPGCPGLAMAQALVNRTGHFLRAVTFHHYYFEGDIASYKNYIDPKYFSDLSYRIETAQAVISKSKYPEMPLWIGETSDSWHSGTPGVSDRFVSGFLWLDKLGVSAQKGIGVVMRQTLYGHHYSLVDTKMNPNPDYWLSAVHHSLVGQTVLDISLTNAPITTRFYAQCTNTKSGLYQPGAVTVFGLNVSPDNVTELSIQGTVFENQPLDAYVLSPTDGLLSKSVYLNGKQRLVMPSETEMPVFTPDRQPAGSKVKLMPLTFGFFVFPEVNVDVCKS